MNLISISEILTPPPRQRQEFPPEALMELTNSIHNNTLLHAPVLRSTPDGMMLVAGERRLRAIKDLWILGLRLVYNGEVIPEGQVPYIDLGELGELEAEEAELDENLKRQDLSWQELAAAHQRLHRLRQKQRQEELSKEMQTSGNGDVPPWTVADTAKELVGRSDGGFQNRVRRELIVARHLDNPEVQAAKSLDDAYKVLVREEIRRKNVETAEAIGQSFRASDHQLFNQA